MRNANLTLSDIERLFYDLVFKTLQELFEKKHLYQSVAIDLSPLEQCIKSGSQGGCPPQPPHHLACGSARGGSGRRVKCDPQGTNRDQTEGLREPLIGPAGLRRHRP